MTTPLPNRPDAPERRILQATAELVAMTDFVRRDDGSWTDGEVSMIRPEPDGRLVLVLTSVDFDPEGGGTGIPRAIPHTLGPFAPGDPVVVSRLIAPIGSMS